MYEIVNQVAVVILDNPPLNSLGLDLRSRIVEALELAQTQPEVCAVVLAGNERSFSAGADVDELGTPRQLREPILRTVVERVESSSKPVVAAISGVALGGGLELALACHGRVALASARVGFPEIALGLIPGSGGTQRLPRLIGVAAAHAMMSSGQPQPAKDLRDAGLFDEVVEDQIIDAAVRRASALARAGAPFPRARDREVGATEVETEVESQRAKLSARQKLQPACTALLEALSAASERFERGLQKERELFLDLLSTSAAGALRHQFKAERAAIKLPAKWQATPRSVYTVAVVGAGTMGVGIALAALDAGLRVLLLEQDKAALDRGHSRIVDHYCDRVAAGKLTNDQVADRSARLAITLEWPRLCVADLVIEAVFEELGVKQAVFKRIDNHARAGAVLATNTSYGNVDEIAAATQRPRDVIGLHFFSPANVMRLVEVVHGAKSSAEAVATGVAFAAGLKKLPVLSGNAFGFIGNRIYNSYRRQCEFMLEDGAWPEDVDNALTAFGFAMGPFAVADMSGLDIAWRMRKAKASSRDPRERYVNILDRLCEAGRYGRKAGAGYYVHDDGRQQKSTDETVRQIIREASARRRIERRALAPEQICRSALLCMVNEAALLLTDGIAVRPSDVDVVLVQGYGFPRWEGGPVFWARQQDRSQLEADLEQLAGRSGHGFVLADLAPLFSD